MKSSTKYWRGIAAVVSIVLAVMPSATLAAVATPAVAQGQTIQRPIQDFLATQGTFCFDNGSGGCILFVPPDPNFLGWTNDLDLSPVFFAGVDYAGLANAYAPGHAPEITGTVTERPLRDGRAEVTVVLHTKNANAWVIELDLSGDWLAQIAGKPTLFGHRPVNVVGGAGQALADSLLHVVFINSAPGAPLPDLLTIGPPDLKFMAFSARMQGPLTAEFGVPEGTPGRGTIIQTGLYMPHGQGQALADSFPAEQIKLRVVGH